MTKKLSRPELLARLRGIKLLSLDVDGVLTDGGLYYAEDGRQLRKFNVKDGMGMKSAMGVGVEIAIISAGDAPCILKRGKDLGIRNVHIGAEDKLAKLKEICAELGIALAHAAHMGDDLNDIPALEAVGCALTVADAVEAVKNLADFVTEKGGGGGAVREICDLLAEAK